MLDQVSIIGDPEKTNIIGSIKEQDEEFKGSNCLVLLGRVLKNDIMERERE